MPSLHCPLHRIFAIRFPPHVSASLSISLCLASLCPSRPLPSLSFIPFLRLPLTSPLSFSTHPCSHPPLLCVSINAPFFNTDSWAQSGFPYVAVFLRKEPEWSQASGSESDAGAGGGASGDGSVVQENKDGIIEGTTENSVQQTYPEVITSLDEIHEVGTLAQASVG